MRKGMLGLSSTLLLFGLIAAGPGPVQAPSEELVIQVSPQTIILGRDANEGNVWVTIHAEIAYSKVSSLQLEGAGGDTLEPIYTKADNRGDLVAKFRYDEVARKLGPGTAVLTLEVEDTGGGTYVGSDEIRVISR